jgi:uncharacterized protein
VRRARILRGSKEPFGFVTSIELLQLDASGGNQCKHGGSFVSLRNTKFVLIHGGAVAFTQVMPYLLMKPNVYTDLSEQTWLISTRKLSQVLRDWLEWYPEKVLFGTDLFPGSGLYDWEEIGWLTSETGRQALAIALTGMMQDGEITRGRAVEIARMVLRENALKLYGWQAGSKR